jgi:MFS family permease
VADLSPRLPFLIYALPVLLLPLLWPVAWQERQTRKGLSSGSAALAQNPSGLQQAKMSGWLIPALAVSSLSVITVMLFFLMPSQLPFYLEEAGFNSATGTALGLGALTLSGAFAALRFQAIRNRLGLPRTFAAGFFIMGNGFAILAIEPAWTFILPGCALIGVGYAFVQPSLILLALDIAPPTRRGTVSGMVTTSMFLGQIVSPFILTPMLQFSGFSAVYLGVGGVFGCLCIAAVVGGKFRRAIMEPVPVE